MRVGPIAAAFAALFVVGCSGGGSSTPTDAQLRSELKGPPNLRAMRDKMANKAPGPPGGKKVSEATSAGGAGTAGTAGTDNGSATGTTTGQ